MVGSLVIALFWNFLENVALKNFLIRSVFGDDMYKSIMPHRVGVVNFVGFAVQVLDVVDFAI